MLLFEGVNDSCCVGCCEPGSGAAQTQMLGGVLGNSCCNMQLEGGRKVRPCVHLKPLVPRESHLQPEWGKYSKADNSAVKRPSAGSFLIDLIVHLMFQLRHQCMLRMCLGSAAIPRTPEGTSPAGGLSSDMEAVITQLKTQPGCLTFTYWQ